METTALRSAYEKLLDAAASPDLSEAADGGWNADQILAHLISADASTAAVALGVLAGVAGAPGRAPSPAPDGNTAGARPTFDNRIALDTWNLARIVGEHSGRADLIDHVRRQATVLCDIADQLDEKTTEVLVPTLLMSNDQLLVDQPVPLRGLIDGLASGHVPDHTQQILNLRRSQS